MPSLPILLHRVWWRIQAKRRSWELALTEHIPEYHARFLLATWWYVKPNIRNEWSWWRWRYQFPVDFWVVRFKHGLKYDESSALRLFKLSLKLDDDKTSIEKSYRRNESLQRVGINLQIWLPNLFWNFYWLGWSYNGNALPTFVP